MWTGVFLAEFYGFSMWIFPSLSPVLGRIHEAAEMGFLKPWSLGQVFCASIPGRECCELPVKLIKTLLKGIVH